MIVREQNVFRSQKFNKEKPPKFYAAEDSIARKVNEPRSYLEALTVF